MYGSLAWTHCYIVYCIPSCKCMDHLHGLTVTLFIVFQVVNVWTTCMDSLLHCLLYSRLRRCGLSGAEATNLIDTLSKVSQLTQLWYTLIQLNHVTMYG